MVDGSEAVCLAAEAVLSSARKCSSTSSRELCESFSFHVAALVSMCSSISQHICSAKKAAMPSNANDIHPILNLAI